MGQHYKTFRHQNNDCSINYAKFDQLNEFPLSNNHCFSAGVVVKWSASLPSSPRIQVQILIKSTVFLKNIVFKKNENKQKEDRVWPALKCNHYYYWGGSLGIVKCVCWILKLKRSFIGLNPSTGSVMVNFHTNLS